MTNTNGSPTFKRRGRGQQSSINWAKVDIFKPMIALRPKICKWMASQMSSPTFIHSGPRIDSSPTGISKKRLKNEIEKPKVSGACMSGPRKSSWESLKEVDSHGVWPNNWFDSIFFCNCRHEKAFLTSFKTFASLNSCNQTGLKWWDYQPFLLWYQPTLIGFSKRKWILKLEALSRWRQ